MIEFGSICSGIESASIAWEPLGMHPLWFSEIEKFPSAVLDHHWPLVANMGDMCALPSMVAAGLVQAPDILVGGTPCQAFSVAGLRKGLEDERGQLTLKYVELLDEIDKKRPDDECVAVWENVPGVLSSKDNAFGCFLGALAGEDCELYPSGEKWTKSGCVYGPKRTIAWRILDAQFFGVAQRRRRVFVVASARDGFDPTKVLFESEGERRDIAPSRETREKTTAFTLSSFAGYREGVGTLRANGGDQGGGSETLNVVHGTQDPCVSENLAFALARNNGAENVVGALTAKGPQDLGAAQVDAGHYIPIENKQWPAEIVATLNASFGDEQGLEDQHALGGASWFVPVLPIHDKTTRHGGKTGRGAGNGLGVGKSDDPMFTLTSGDKHAVCIHQNSRNELRETTISNTLSSGGGKPGQGYAAIRHGSSVRRLMPVECERLQGFPDNHTQIPYRNKPAEDCPDGPRYKAIGNSKAVPVIRWVGKRILEELNK